jgi:phage tail sheath protein FI
MAQETLISPGVLTRENDLSQITQNPVTVGLSLVGPTVTGPVNIPTVVTSYSNFKNKFGGMFTSGGANYEFLTSIAARNYFQQGGSTVLVTRVTDDTYTSATSSAIPNSLTSVTGVAAKASIDLSTWTGATGTAYTGSGYAFTIVDSNNNYYYLAGSAWGANYGTNGSWSSTLDYGYFSPNAGNSYTLNEWTSSLGRMINNTSELSSLITFRTGSASLLQVTASSVGAGANGLKIYAGLFIGQETGSNSPVATLSGGVSPVYDTAFVLETLSTGVVMNNSGSILSNGSLASGSSSNIRWEVQNANTSSGTFTLLVRQGDDNTQTPTVLETFSNLSLDPNQPNYIESVIGNQTKEVIKDADGNFYIRTSGDYRNSSNYIRVKQVNYSTPNYLDNSGNAKNEYTASIPLNGSGSQGGAFGGAAGDDLASIGNTLFTNIGSTTQGLTAAAYATASDLLSNKDDYDFTLLSTPGLIQSLHSSAVRDFIDLAENRGDCFYIADLRPYGATLSQVTNTAAGLDTNYAGAYWPWVQVISQETGKQVWVPASTIMTGVYAFSDNTSAEWFAPAGLTRGGLGNVLQAERKLSPTDRDNLYAGKVNPIATFPNIGIAAFGQKTLQKKASALDRINVRRLLIALKRYIGNVAENLVFEQNTATTRNSFINSVTPYLESVQQRQGLYAFRVVMDDSNNTPDVIDRNQLVGQIYLQPTRTAEFILLDFNILPTGVQFGS